MNVAANTLSLIKSPRETRRFARLTIPATVRLHDKVYTVRNWSTDGVCLSNCNFLFAEGKAVSMRLLLAMADANIGIDLTARVVWSDPLTKQCGLQFVNPEPKKVALMEEVIGLNLRKYGKTSATRAPGMTRVASDIAEPGPAGGRMKRVAGLLLFAAIGLSSALFLGKTLYDRQFLFEAASASIFAETVNIAAQGEGTVSNIIGGGIVKEGQVLAQIALASGGNSDIRSSCACEIVSILKQNGSFVRAGESVINLVKVDAKPVVSVRVTFHDLERVVKGATVSLLYLDGTTVKGAKITELTKIVDDRSSFVTLYVEAGRDLSPAQVGQPVYAVIDTGPW
jgi:PilZ domain/HlyD family secretion protein